MKPFVVSNASLPSLMAFALAMSATAFTAMVLLIGTGTASTIESLEPLGRAAVLRAEASVAIADFAVVVDQPSVGL